MKATKISVIKSKSNSGEFAKTTVYFMEDDILDNAILIVKTILVETEEMFQLYCKSGFFVGRQFKGKILVNQIFSIKISTFEKVNKSLKKFIEDENQRDRNR